MPPNPDRMAALTEACRTTLEKIKDKDVRREYALYFRAAIRDLRAELSDLPNIDECLRAPATDAERKWIKTVFAPLALDLASAAVLDIEGQTYAVFPIGQTFIDIQKAGWL